MVIRRVAPVPCAKVAGVLYGLMGFIIGGFISLASLAGLAYSNVHNAAFAALMGVGAVIVLPIFYGALGFVLTLIMAALYNVVAGVVGGIEIEVQ